LVPIQLADLGAFVNNAVAGLRQALDAPEEIKIVSLSDRSRLASAT
jgi:hypothetical protein